MEFPRTRAFKITWAMDQWLIRKAQEDHRKVGDEIRVLLMRIMEAELLGKDGKGIESEPEEWQ